MSFANLNEVFKHLRGIIDTAQTASQPQERTNGENVTDTTLEEKDSQNEEI